MGELILQLACIGVPVKDTINFLLIYANTSDKKELIMFKKTLKYSKLN